MPNFFQISSFGQTDIEQGLFYALRERHSTEHTYSSSYNHHFHSKFCHKNTTVRNL